MLGLKSTISAKHYLPKLRRTAQFSSLPISDVGVQFPRLCNARHCDLPSGGASLDKEGVAIQFARARYVSRKTGGNAVRSAAYNERTAITSERTGELFSFKHRDAPEHHEVLLPEGAAAKFAASAVPRRHGEPHTAAMGLRALDCDPLNRELGHYFPATMAPTTRDPVQITAWLENCSCGRSRPGRALPWILAAATRPLDGL
jgi:hypothetical protein